MNSTFVNAYIPRARNNIIVNKSNSAYAAFQLRFNSLPFLFTVVGSSSKTGEEWNGRMERRGRKRRKKEKKDENEMRDKKGEGGGGERVRLIRSRENRGGGGFRGPRGETR